MNRHIYILDIIFDKWYNFVTAAYKSRYIVPHIKVVQAIKSCKIGLKALTIGKSHKIPVKS
jgi:hypothetical protein